MKKVRCINNKSINGSPDQSHILTVGKIYEVIREDSGHIRVIGDNRESINVWKERFQYISKDEKIIGYKCPMDMFKGMISKGDKFTPVEKQDGLYSCKKSLTHDSPFYSLPAEIVQQWEPIYEETKKEILIGDPQKKAIVEKDRVTVDGKTFVIEHIRELKSRLPYSFIVSGLNVVASFWIGCESGTKITRSDIDLIYNEMQKL